MIAEHLKGPFKGGVLLKIYGQRVRVGFDLDVGCDAFPFNLGAIREVPPPDGEINGRTIRQLASDVYAAFAEGGGPTTVARPLVCMAPAIISLALAENWFTTTTTGTSVAGPRRRAS